MRPPEFYQRHLDAVSRSFALCIPQLDQPLRDQVALSYLLLRVLDTVEDAPFADRALQQRQFTAFRQFLVKMPTRARNGGVRAAARSAAAARSRGRVPVLLHRRGAGGRALDRALGAGGGNAAADALRLPLRAVLAESEHPQGPGRGRGRRPVLGP